MNRLTQEERRHYDREGYVLIRGLLTMNVTSVQYGMSMPVC